MEALLPVPSLQLYYGIVIILKLGEESLFNVRGA